LLSRRMHDVLATLQALRNGPQQAKSLALVGEGRETGPIALAARLAAGKNVERTVAMTAGFRFASVTRFDDPMFVPGAVKYDDLEGLARLGHTSLLWLDQPNTVLAEETLISWLRQ
jgi:hypothetical protein